MDKLLALQSPEQWIALAFVLVGLVVVLWLMLRLLNWARKAPKGAYLFLALFPLISIFPIPPQATESLDKTKREQQKLKESPDDDPNDKQTLDATPND